VFEKLSGKLEDSDLFFEHLSSLDLIVYAYLKELMNNLRDESEVLLLEEFPNLQRFMLRLEEYIVVDHTAFKRLCKHRVEWKSKKGIEKTVQGLLQKPEYLGNDSKRKQTVDITDKAQK
jgi:hypothetical protein